MGLPIWREPVSPTKAKTVTDTIAAAARSGIRRRPSVHGSRSSLQGPRSSIPGARRRVPGERAASRQRPTFPPPPPLPAATARLSRRNDRSGVPPISTLLESTALPPLPPPPPPLPVPRLRNFDSLQAREREIVASLASLHEQAALLRRDTQEILREGGQAGAAEREGEAGAAREERGSRLTWRNGRPMSRTLDRILRRSRNRNLPYPPGRSWDTSDAPRERGESAFERSVLPTPPLEQSEDLEGDSLFLPDTNAANRPSHPLSRSWRPESPIDGLGDRDRSPTPADAWEVMQTTITPDATLPSASSSFASGRGGTDTTITEPERASPSSSDDSDSSSSSDDDSDDSPNDFDMDADDLQCREEEASMMLTTASFARAMYNRERATPSGRARIAAHNELRDEEGNRFALAGEPHTVDIGFRLIEDALETEEGRGRVFELQGGVEDEGTVQRMVRFRREGGQERFGEPALAGYARAVEGEGEEWSTSQDGPLAHPVSPPVTRSGGGGLDAFLRDVRPDGSGEVEVGVGLGRVGESLGDESIGGMRRVVDRLARRGDVPEEWWAGMGLNFPQARRAEEGEGLLRGESRL